MSEHMSKVKYVVAIEGADDSIKEFQGILSQVQQGITAVSRLDYLMLSWERAAKRANIPAFLSATIATISAIETMIKLIKAATQAQLVLNAVRSVGSAFGFGGLGGIGGPLGMLIGLGVSIGLYAASQYRPPEPQSYVHSKGGWPPPPPAPGSWESPPSERGFLEGIFEEERKREQFRGKVPE